MAVQAQFPCSSNALDFQANRATDNAIKDRQIGNLFLGQQQILTGDGVVVVGNPINATGTRKRNRDTAMIQQFHFPIASKIPKPSISAVPISSNNQEIPCYLYNQQQQQIQCQERVLQSAGTSTSGTTIDALIHLHNAKIKSGINQLQKKHSAELLLLFDNQAARKIAEKDAEIDNLRRKQGELESRLKEISAESQIWFTVARNSEVLASNLRASLEQVLLRQKAVGECQVASVPAEDAGSCCNEGGGDEGTKQGFRSCRACGERNVSVLLLPCRHLCLCLECEPVTGTCPICCAAKNVGVQVFLE